jgi:uncharacterized membrane protein
MWLPVLGLLLVSLCIAAAWRALGRVDATASNEVKAVTVTAGADVRLSSAEMRPGMLVAFRSVVEKQEVRFVVMRSTDDVARAALASCQTCYGSRQQHRLLESGVICARCGHRMHIPRPGEPQKTGGCSLVKLPYQDKEGSVVISAAAVAEVTHALRQGGLDR